MAAVTTSTDIRRRAAAGLDAAAAAAAVAPVQSSPRRIAASCAVLVTLALICAVAASASDVRDGTSESFGPASGKVLAQGLESAFVIETSASNRRHHRQLAAASQNTGAGSAHTQIHSHGAAPRSSGLLRAAEKRVSAYLRDKRGGGEHAQQDGAKADGKGQDDRQSTGQTLQRSSCAVLISGLRQRFLYRDSNANYTGLDVFVVLQDTAHGAVPRWTGPPIATQPYSTDVATITAHLKAHGAVHVQIEIWPDARVQSAVAQMENKFGPDVRYRSASNSIMLFLRHTVYQHAIRHHNYSQFFYFREDNVFTEPGSLQVLSALDQKLATKCLAHACVVVDHHCGWGALSDKVYWTTWAAAEVIFGDDLWFHGMMKFWTKMSGPGFEDQQTEKMLTQWMQENGVTTVQADFERTELRYVWTNDTTRMLCVPFHYAECTSRRTANVCMDGTNPYSQPNSSKTIAAIFEAKLEQDKQAAAAAALLDKVVAPNTVNAPTTPPGGVG